MIDHIKESYQEINQNYTRLLDALSALRALSDIDIETTREAALLQKSLDILMEYQDMQHCTIFLTCNEGLPYAAGTDLCNLRGGEQQLKNPFATLRGKVLSTGHGVLSQVADSRQPQRSEHCSPSQIFDLNETSLTTQAGGFTLSVPIVSGSDLLGVLIAYYPKPQTAEDSEQMLLLFSNFLGQILANLRRTRFMEAEIDRRTHQLELALIEAQNLKRRFEELSSVDELTGLYNRRHFFPAAKAAMAHAIRRNESFSVLAIDLDLFKSINDRFGHAAGDTVLEVAASIFKEIIRESDLLARFGGEEFIIALPDTGLAGAKQMASRILGSLGSRKVDVDSQQIKVSATIGISVRDESETRNEQTLEQMIKESDQALYFGKEHGRNQANAFAEINCAL